MITQYLYAGVATPEGEPEKFPGPWCSQRPPNSVHYFPSKHSTNLYAKATGEVWCPPAPTTHPPL